MGSGNNGSIPGFVYKYCNVLPLHRQDCPGARDLQGCLAIVASLNHHLLFRSVDQPATELATKLNKDTLLPDGVLLLPGRFARQEPLYSHMSSDGVFLHLLRIASDMNHFHIDTFSVLSDGMTTLLVRSVPMCSGFTQFPSTIHLADPSKVDLRGARFQEGQMLDCQDSVGKWCAATVLDVTSTDILVHYAGWATKWDERIPLCSPRLARFQEYTGRPDVLQHAKKEKNDNDMLVVTWLRSVKPCVHDQVLPEHAFYLHSFLHDTLAENVPASFLAAFKQASLFPPSSTLEKEEWKAVSSKESAKLEQSYQDFLNSKTSKGTMTMLHGFHEVTVDFQRLTLTKSDSGREYKLQRRDPYLVQSSTHSRVYLEDISLFCTGAQIVFYFPPRFGPNRHDRALLRIFDAATGQMVCDWHFPETGTNSFSAFSFDKHRNEVIGYCGHDFTVHRWTNVGPGAPQHNLVDPSLLTRSLLCLAENMFGEQLSSKNSVLKNTNNDSEYSITALRHLRVRTTLFDDVVSVLPTSLASHFHRHRLDHDRMSAPQNELYSLLFTEQIISRLSQLSGVVSLSSSINKQNVASVSDSTTKANIALLSTYQPSSVDLDALFSSMVSTASTSQIVIPSIPFVLDLQPSCGQLLVELTGWCVDQIECLCRNDLPDHRYFSN